MHAYISIENLCAATEKKMDSHEESARIVNNRKDAIFFLFQEDSWTVSIVHQSESDR